MSSERRLPRVPLRQGYCADHGCFREYPAFVLPHKHYVASVVRAAVRYRTLGLPMSVFCLDWCVHERSTPCRWVREADLPGPDSGTLRADSG